MSGAGSEQTAAMRWVLFYVFVGIFVLIVLATLAALFLGFGNLSAVERDKLFNIFIIEVGLGVVALFWSIFELKRQKASTRIRLNLGEFADINDLIGKTAILSPSREDGHGLGELQRKVLNDNGPFLPLDLPDTAHSVYVSIETAGKRYAGSFVVGTYLVDVCEEEG